jgi:ADP-ribose pyrophosphatase YjhB (NUDIX family)
MPHNPNIQNVTVTIVVNHKILTCYRGVQDGNYGKPFGPGGRIDTGETCLQAAVRETKEETGITISQNDLCFYSDLGNRRNYIVTMHMLPLNFAPSSRHAGEMIQTSSILGVPTSISQGGGRWALVSVNNVIMSDATSPFVKMIRNMKSKNAL